MLCYLFLAFELAILYAVFWYLFVREPKEYKVSGPLWGVYELDKDLSADATTRAQSDSIVLSFSGKYRKGVQVEENSGGAASSRSELAGDRLDQSA